LITHKLGDSEPNFGVQLNRGVAQLVSANPIALRLSECVVSNCQAYSPNHLSPNMKLRLLSVILTCALAILPSVHAQAPKGAAKRQFDTPLSDNMAKMNDALRTIREQAADASKNADSAKLAASIKELSTASLKLEPAKKADIPAAEQAKFVAGYKEAMQKQVDLATKLEAAFKAGDNAAAGKLLDDLGTNQKASHKEYKQQKKKM
jgi:hypothetical protein